MDIIKDIKNGKPLFLTDEFKYMTRGTSGAIYLLNPNLIIKIPLETSSKKVRSITTDYEFQKEIFDAGYPVPEPYGLVRATYDESFFPSAYLNLEKCLGMERIHGNNLFLLDDKHYSISDIIEMKHEAKNIVSNIYKNLGLAPGKQYRLWDSNIMWDEINKRIVLIDFEN